MTSVKVLTGQLLEQIIDRHLENVRDLLERGADINGYDDHGWTPLILAASIGSMPIVCELLKDTTVDVNCRLRWRPGGITALVIASHRGHAEVVRKLLLCPLVDVNAATGIKGYTSLIYASHCGHDEIVRALMLDDRVDANARDNYGNTPLMLANSHPDRGPVIVRELLLYHRVDVNAKNFWGDTALTLAGSHGQVGVVCELLRHERVDVNAMNNNGNTALLLASSFGPVTAARQCPPLPLSQSRSRLQGRREIARGNMRREDQHAAFLAANLRWREAIVIKLLKDDRVDPNIKDMNGRTGMSWASYIDNIAMVHAFLNHKTADVNATNSHGNTALMWACLRGQSVLVSELMQHARVDMHAKNKAGSTALDIAKRLDMFNIVICLEEHISNH